MFTSRLAKSPAIRFALLLAILPLHAMAQPANPWDSAKPLISIDIDKKDPTGRLTIENGVPPEGRKIRGFGFYQTSPDQFLLNSITDDAGGITRNNGWTTGGGQFKYIYGDIEGSCDISGAMHLSTSQAQFTLGAPSDLDMSKACKMNDITVTCVPAVGCLTS